MTAAELRIGNWVEIKDQVVRTFAQTEGVGSLQDVAGQLWSIEELKPIPLTEEWLERFGFNKVSHIWEFWKNSGWDLRQHKLEDKWWLFYMGQDLDCVRIDYVHQLQNLYFALTGEELELKQ